MDSIKEECPSGETETFNTDQLRRSTSIVNPPRTYPPKIRLSDSADAYIVGLAVDLAIAEIGLEQLPNSLMEFYTYAYEAGRASRQDEIDRLNWECDRWYFCYANKKQPGEFLRHLTNELWAEAVK